MKTQSERIKQRRQELEMSQQEVSDLVGVSRVSVTHWESDPTVEIKGKNLARLAKALKTSSDYLLTGALPRTEQDRGKYLVENNITRAPRIVEQVPMISWVQAGNWTEACDIDVTPEEWLPRPPGASEETFALRVVGPSMTPRYNPGSIIFVDPAVQPDSGDDVVAVLTDTGEATFKRLLIEPGSPMMLMAINETWPQRFVEINGNCQIVGTVVADMNLRNR